jgi:hypothetical protein
MTSSPTVAAVMALACACYVLTGCSHGAQAAGSGNPVPGTSSAQGAAMAVCDRYILKPEDLAGILRAPITGTKQVPGDAQSCEFGTASFPAITISIRPGLGRTTVDAWATGKMPLASSPLAGVGDAAVWQEELHEVIAQKNALLCDIQVRAGAGDLAIASSALPAALGGLCNRVFAAY